jgi:hypothetical protein
MEMRPNLRKLIAPCAVCVAVFASGGPPLGAVCVGESGPCLGSACSPGAMSTSIVSKLRESQSLFL